MATFILPSRTHCELTGVTRRVGFEIEFTGLELMEVANLVAESVDGRPDKQTEAECLIDCDLGEFKVELDWDFGKRLARERQEAHTASEDDPAMKWLTTAAAQLVPIEVVCPPISMDRLDRLNPMIDLLREHGAEGTSASPIYAFGVHINPELPDLEVDTIRGYLLAFCLCQSWLQQIHEVDLSRRLTPYVDLFPNSYIEKLIAEPPESLATLIDQYAEFNRTRNRALDMTPLFRYLDEDRLTRLIDDDRINARPTLHYRLPNSTPERPGWYLSDSWRPWCVIEELAMDDHELRTLADAWVTWQDKSVKLENPPWFEMLDERYDKL